MKNITLLHGDITELDVDAIVNAANRGLLGGGGVDGAIHAAAGPELLEECRTLFGCETGQAKITKGYRLKARHVIHTVGPVYSGAASDPKLLADCYYNSLEVARENGLHSIAFPSISTGAYGYPIRDAIKVALASIEKWQKEHVSCEMDITLICFDQPTYDVYKEVLG